MERKVYIYKIISPSNKIYVGSTVSIKNRKLYYKNECCKNQSIIYNSIKKYGWENHIFEIIEECGIQSRNKREFYWGNYFKVLGADGLNCRLPKIDDEVYVVRKETREKMSKWQIGRKMSKEAREKMSKAATGRKRSKESIAKSTAAASIPIFQMDLNNNIIKEWESASEASRQLKINAGHIRSCCRGVRKTSGGFKWKNKN